MRVEMPLLRSPEDVLQALQRKNDAFMSWRELLFFGLRKVTVFCGITAR